MKETDFVNHCVANLIGIEQRNQFEFNTAQRFKSQFFQRIVDLRNECAALHVSDPQLDEELTNILAMRDLPFSFPDGKGGTVYRTDPDAETIKKIGDRLAVLSTEVK